MAVLYTPTGVDLAVLYLPRSVSVPAKGIIVIELNIQPYWAIFY